MSNGGTSRPVPEISQPDALRETLTVSVPVRTPPTRTTNVAGPVLSDPCVAGVWCAAATMAPRAVKTPTIDWVTRPFVTAIEDQYRIITSAGAGWIDYDGRGRLQFEGSDALSFLHAIVSNDVEGLIVGRGVYAALLTPQGRMVTDMRIYHRGESLLVDVPPGLAEALTSRFDQAIFAEDVRVSNASSQEAQIGIIGRGAEAAIGKALSIDTGVLTALPLLGQFEIRDGFVVRTDDARVPTFDVFVPSAARASLVGRLEAAGVSELSDDLRELLRIEAGRPAFGVDMTSETIPLEAGLLERAISTSKGCYVGQEVIIRVLHRGGGRVVKRLAMLDIEAPVALDDVREPPAGETSPSPRRGRAVLQSAPDAGTVLLVEGREVGRVTSAAFAPYRGLVVALGYVHRDHAEAGRRLDVAGAAGLTATIKGFAH
jgi:folate-binding protein YgfZ